LVAFRTWTTSRTGYVGTSCKRSVRYLAMATGLKAVDGMRWVLPTL
jgi:hypothetical protein